MVVGECQVAEINRLVSVGLVEKLIFDKDMNNVKELAMLICGQRRQRKGLAHSERDEEASEGKVERVRWKVGDIRSQKHKGQIMVSVGPPASRC